jgi:nucleotide-binding universal stress UspA family protein
MSEHNRPAGRAVVVGIDGSLSSRQALRFAAKEARQRNAALTIVMSQADGLRHGGVAAATDDRLQAAQRTARTIVEQEVHDHTGLTLEVVTTTTPPTTALVDRSADADLLVVGSRGRGGFRGLVMGSVSLQCVLHAHCPVVVVRTDYDVEQSVNGSESATHSLDDARQRATATFL